eukprot:3599791-Pleurochrysis_carterae.AAC.2
MTRAIPEYFLHISQTVGGIDIDLPDSFGSAAYSNVDFARLFYFVYDYAYLVLDFKQGVRCGNGKHLDLMWREFFSLGRASTANKTNCVPMATKRTFTADALHPQLAQLYQSMRSIPMSEREVSMVRLDCVGE